MTAYYNEHDRFAAAWLRELIAEGHIADGHVDERSIEDVHPDDLVGFTQHHFFAGIGIWSAALRTSGWPDDRPVWTGSCPCQPFSQAGKGLGFDDPRHLWPKWFRLIAERRPDTLFGEQSSNAGLWVDLVRTDLEGVGAAFGCVDIPAAGFAFGAHIRQRFYWVADFDDAERWADLAGRDVGDWPKTGRIESHGQSGAGLTAGGMADLHGSERRTCDPVARRNGESAPWRTEPPCGRASDGMGHADSALTGEKPRNNGEVPGLQKEQWADLSAALSGGGSAAIRMDDTASPRHGGKVRQPEGAPRNEARMRLSGPGREGDWLGDTAGPQWSEIPGVGGAGTWRVPVGPDSSSPTEWLWCRDERWRLVERGTFPLVAAHPGRVGLLRGYGNALDLETAVNFISAYMEAEQCL